MCLTTRDYGIICHKYLPTQFPITAVIQQKRKNAQQNNQEHTRPSTLHLVQSSTLAKCVQLKYTPQSGKLYTGLG